MKKYSITLVIGLCIVGALAGCGDSEPKPAATTVLDSQGNKPKTTADPEFKSNPNIP